LEKAKIKIRITNPKENQLIVENMHESIIDIETFNKYQKLKEFNVLHFGEY